MLKNIPKIFQFIFELELKRDVQQSYPVPSGSSWKLFEIPMCLASLYAVQRTECVE
jgi:hypothetical protein